MCDRRDSSINQPSSAPHLFLVAVFGVLASLAMFAVMLRLDRLRAEAQFQEMAAQRLSAVKGNVSAAFDTIEILASHFEATGAHGTSRQTFATLVSPVLANHRYLKALAWIPCVDQDAGSRYEQLARRDGRQSFRFGEVRRDGSLAVAAQRDRFYVEPVADNEAALGYDLLSNPVRAAAMAQARDTGHLVATARVQLAQEKAGQWGTLIFAPVYSPLGAAGVEGRRQALQGFALSVLRIGDLLSEPDDRSRQAGPQSLPDSRMPAVDLHLFDMSAPASDRQLYPSEPVTEPGQWMSGFHAGETLEVGGRTWLLAATPGPGFSDRPGLLGAFLVLASGLGLTAMYVRYLKAGIAQSLQIASAAHEIGRTQAELQETNGMLEAVIQCSPLAVVTVDLAGKATMWNPAAERLHGWTKEELLSGFLPIVLFENRQGEGRSIHDKILKEGGSTGFEYFYLRKDGSPITVSVSGAPLKSAAGTRNGAVYLVKDITERRRLEAQLAQAQKLESIGQLAAGIAHEINTPIQYVGDNLHFLEEAFANLSKLNQAHRVLVQAVRDGESASGLLAELETVIREVDLDFLHEEVPQAFRQSLEGTTQIARIVNAMKEFSHCGTLAKTAVDLNHAIRNTILVSRHEWKYVADVQTDLARDLPAVECVPTELNQVLLNLIINAAHAIADVVEQRPGAKGIITVSTRRHGDSVEIRVQDTGAGIPASVCPNVFNPFFTTKPVNKGTGQGLAIAHAVIVGKHNGAITFDTEVGVGTTFIVRLPTGQAGFQ